MKKAILAVVILAVVIGGFYAARRLCGKCCRMRAGRTACELYAGRIPGLDREQRARMDTLDAALQKDLAKNDFDTAQVRVAVCDSIKRGKSGAAEIERYSSQLGRLQAEREKRMLLNLVQARAVLTDEQRDKYFSSMMQKICAGCRRGAQDGGRCICGMTSCGMASCGGGKSCAPKK